MFGLEQYRLSISYGFPFHHCDRQEMVKKKKKNQQHSKHNGGTFERAPVKQAIETLRSLNIPLSEMEQVNIAISRLLERSGMAIIWVRMF